MTDILEGISLSKIGALGTMTIFIIGMVLFFSWRVIRKVIDKYKNGN